MGDNDFQVKVSPHQLAYMIEAFHDFIIIRLKWCSSIEFVDWRTEVEFEIPQSVIGDMVNMYGYCLQAYRANDEANVELVEIVSFTEKQWELLNTIHTASSWDEVPVVNRDVFE